MVARLRTAAARSPARTRPRSIARPRTPPAGWRRTSWPRGSPTAARSRWPTRLASRIRSRSSSTRSRRRRSRCRGSRSSCASTSTSARPRSCAISTCGGRSTRRRPRTGTSAARTRASRGRAPTAPTRCARRRGSRNLRRSDEEPGGGLLRDRPLADLLDRDRELIRRRFGAADENARAGHEALVVEPVQEVAVVLREADDRRPRAGLQCRERRELGVLCLLDLGIDRPAVRAALRMAERVVELVGALVRLVSGVAHEIGEGPLDDPVLADDTLGALAAGLGEERLLL